MLNGPTSNNSIVKLNDENLQLIDTDDVDDTGDRKLEYFITNISVGDQIHCFTKSVSPNGSTFCWGHSSCALFGLK